MFISRINSRATLRTSNPRAFRHYVASGWNLSRQKSSKQYKSTKIREYINEHIYSSEELRIRSIQWNCEVLFVCIK